MDIPPPPPLRRSKRIYEQTFPPPPFVKRSRPTKLEADRWLTIIDDIWMLVASYLTHRQVLILLHLHRLIGIDAAKHLAAVRAICEASVNEVSHRLASLYMQMGRLRDRSKPPKVALREPLFTLMVLNDDFLSRTPTAYLQWMISRRPQQHWAVHKTATRVLALNSTRFVFGYDIVQWLEAESLARNRARPPDAVLLPLLKVVIQHYRRGVWEYLLPFTTTYGNSNGLARELFHWLCLAENGGAKASIYAAELYTHVQMMQVSIIF